MSTKTMVYVLFVVLFGVALTAGVIYFVRLESTTSGGLQNSPDNQVVDTGQNSFEVNKDCVIPEDLRSDANNIEYCGQVFEDPNSMYVVYAGQIQKIEQRDDMMYVLVNLGNVSQWFPSGSIANNDKFVVFEYGPESIDDFGDQNEFDLANSDIEDIATRYQGKFAKFSVFSSSGLHDQYESARQLAVQDLDQQTILRISRLGTFLEKCSGSIDENLNVWSSNSDHLISSIDQNCVPEINSLQISIK